jgi:hypothetical protein
MDQIQYFDRSFQNSNVEYTWTRCMKILSYEIHCFLLFIDSICKLLVDKTVVIVVDDDINTD